MGYRFQASIKAAKQLGLTRSALTREDLRSALARLREKEMERQHRQGYLNKPAKPDEFSDWEDEQVWID